MTRKQRTDSRPARRARTSGIAIFLLSTVMATSALANKDSSEPPPPAVVVAAIESKPVEQSKRYIGNIQAVRSVDIVARVEGFLEAQAFTEGSMIETGQLLFKIEDLSYQAQVAAAEGQFESAVADTASAQALLDQREADFERQKLLVERGDTSQTAFDQARAIRDEALASVRKGAAAQEQAKAAVRNAVINLGYTTIHSPISGRIGRANVTPGNLVNAASGPLATVVQLDPIRAAFSIPSAQYVSTAEQIAGPVASETERKRLVPRLILPTGETYEHQGQISFVDNKVDPRTGTVTVYAEFPNPDQVLLPGQFITASIGLADPKRAPVVPAAALMQDAEGAEVYLLDKDNHIVARKIETGPRVGDGYAVTSGLQAGELVVVSGLQKVKPGMQVKPTRADQSGAKAAGQGTDASQGTDTSEGTSGS